MNFRKSLVWIISKCFVIIFSSVHFSRIKDKIKGFYFTVLRGKPRSHIQMIWTWTKISIWLIWVMMSHVFFEILIFRNSSSFSIFGGSNYFERTNDRSQKRIFTMTQKPIFRFIKRNPKILETRVRFRIWAVLRGHQ